MNEMHLNDAGTLITLTVVSETVPQNISSATTKEFYFEAPSGATLTKTATFTTSGTEGKLYYISQADDFDEIGTWKIQARVAWGSVNLKSDIISFLVKRNIL